MRSSEYSRAVESGLVRAPYSNTPFPEECRPRHPKRALTAAVGVFSGGANKFDCTISDISQDGARIAIPKNTPHPPQFFLINVCDRVAHSATVVWERGSQAGLSFASTIRLAELADPSLSFLEKCWFERAVR